MSYGPNPASLTLLESLGHFPTRAKVRFLGCIESYESSSATLTVAHNTIYNNSAQPGIHRAKVDITNVVRTLSTDIIQDGDWINIIGYVTGAPPNVQSTTRVVYIQAVQIWSAGAIDLGAYERSLREKLAIDERSLYTLRESAEGM